MADVYGSNTNKLVNTPSDLADAFDVGGAIRVFSDVYEAVSVAIGQTIGVAKLPAGARIKEIVVDHDALGASTTLACGDAGDPDRYIAAASTSGAGALRLGTVGGRNYAVAADDGGNDTTEIRLVVGGAAVTGTIKTTVSWAYA